MRQCARPCARIRVHALQCAPMRLSVRPIQWLRSFSNLGRSRFVRRDRSSPVKKNAQIFLVVVGMVILFSSAQSDVDLDHAATPNFDGARQHRWAWLSQIFLRCIGADLDLIKNAEHFARIDLDRSRFEKECNKYISGKVSVLWCKKPSCHIALIIFTSKCGFVDKIFSLCCSCS